MPEGAFQLLVGEIDTKETSWFPQQTPALRIKLLRQYYRQSKVNLVRLLRQLLNRTNSTQIRHERYTKGATRLEQYLPRPRERLFDQSLSPLWDYNIPTISYEADQSYVFPSVPKMYTLW